MQAPRRRLHGEQRAHLGRPGAVDLRQVDGTAETPLPPARNPERGYMTAAGVERYRGRLQELVQRRDELLATHDDDLPERSELAAIERELAHVTAVLQGVQAVVGEFGDFLAGSPDAEYAALFARFVLQLAGHIAPWRRRRC